MEKRKNVQDSRVVKTKGGLTINYIPIPTMNRVLKKNLALNKWQRNEAERIEKLRGKPKWEEATDRFRKTLMQKQTALLKIERDFKNKQRRAHPEPCFRPPPPLDPGFNRILSLTHWKKEDLWPDEILVGHSYLQDGQPVFEASNLIYPCPDDGKGKRWSAWFQNNYVELHRLSSYTIEGSSFTGNLKISMWELAEGVADINAGGYVSLGVGASAELWRNTGSAQQPQWRLVDIRSSGLYPDIKTLATGVVSLEPAELWHSWEFSLGMPGDVIETRQYVRIKAVDAHVQMGYNREDCASGNRFGYIYTSMPSLELQYLNRIRPTLAEIPHNFSWP